MCWSYFTSMYQITLNSKLMRFFHLCFTTCLQNNVDTFIKYVLLIYYDVCNLCVRIMVCWYMGVILIVNIDTITLSLVILCFNMHTSMKLQIDVSVLATLTPNFLYVQFSQESWPSKRSILKWKWKSLH
jgi:hypothetical protein